MGDHCLQCYIMISNKYILDMVNYVYKIYLKFSSLFGLNFFSKISNNI